MAKVTAHRGFSDRYPENTRPAFQSALDLNVHMIELDVRLCQDGLVVFHDNMLDKKTDGHGRPEDKTLAELLALDNGSWFDPAMAGEPMLTFEQTAELIGNKTLLNVHLKGGDRNEQLVAATLDVLEQYNLAETAFIASDPTVLEIARSMNASVKRCLLEPVRAEPQPWVQMAVDLGCHYLQPVRKTVTPDFVAEAHRNNIELIVYYANTRPAMHDLIGLGVDYILTDRADLLTEVLKAYE